MIISLCGLAEASILLPSDGSIILMGSVFRQMAQGLRSLCALNITKAYFIHSFIVNIYLVFQTAIFYTWF